MMERNNNSGLVKRLTTKLKNHAIVAGQSLLEGYAMPTILWGIGLIPMGIGYVSMIWNAQGVIDAASLGGEIMDYYVHTLPKYMIGYGGSALSLLIYSIKMVRGVDRSAKNIIDMWREK